MSGDGMMESVTLATTSTTPARRGAARGQLAQRRRKSYKTLGGKGSLPEYLEAAEVKDLMRYAPHGACRTAHADPVARRSARLGGPGARGPRPAARHRPPDASGPARQGPAHPHRSGPSRSSRPRCGQATRLRRTSCRSRDNAPDWSQLPEVRRPVWVRLPLSSGP